MVRNGYHQERELVTGAGKVPVRQPRVHGRRPTERFTSAILPPYLRRTPSIDALIPALYLKGVSTSAFAEALQAVLKQVWEQEFQAWSKRDLHGKRYVYLWADAVYFNVRLQKDRPCVLVVVGATEDGHKELLAVQDGERESHLSRSEGSGPEGTRLPGRRRWCLGLLEGSGGGAARRPHPAVLGTFQFADGRYTLDAGLIRQLVDASTTGDARYTPGQARREVRKLETAARRQSWRKAYRALKKKRPHMSDVWYSRRIANMEVARGRAAETIRKQLQP